MIDGWRSEYQSIPELYSQMDGRWIINPGDYTSLIMSCGDIFVPDPYGAYDIVSGECVVPFDGSCFWRDRRGNKIPVNNHDDMEAAENDIVDRYERKRLLHRDIKRFRYEFVRPERIRAKDAAVAIIADGFEDVLDVIVPKQIPKIRDVIDVDYKFPGSRVAEAINRTRERAIVDFRENMEGREWNEFSFRLNNIGDIVIEMSMDTRIRFFYEHHLREQMQREIDRD